MSNWDLPAFDRQLETHECIGLNGSGKLIYMKYGTYGVRESPIVVSDMTSAKVNLAGLKSAVLSRGADTSLIDKKGISYTNTGTKLIETLSIEDYISRLYVKLDLEEQAREIRKQRKETIDNYALLVTILFGSNPVGWTVLGLALTVEMVVYAATLAYGVYDAVQNDEIEEFGAEELVALIAEIGVEHYVPIKAPSALFRIVPESAHGISVRIGQKIGGATAKALFCMTLNGEAKIGDTESTLLTIHRLRLKFDPNYRALRKQCAEATAAYYQARNAYAIDHQ